MTKQIPLTGKKGAGLFALVDGCDFEELSQYRWYLDTGGYACRSLHGQRPNKESMHRRIMNAPSGMQIDHINHNKLDNRRENLRVATHTQNTQNRCPKPTDSSRYKGVGWDKERSMWTAKISVNKRTVNLGRFTTQREAALAYNEAATKLFGEFAYLNDVPIVDLHDCPVPKAERIPTSAYRGVSWSTRDNRWVVHVAVGHRVVYGKNFTDELEAAKAYDTAARIYHGEKAKLNFP